MLAQNTAAWPIIKAHARLLSSTHISDLFRRSPDRFAELSFNEGDLLLDLSKQRLEVKTLNLLTQLAEQCNLSEWIEALYNGKHVNHSEDRPALHTALRLPEQAQLELNGSDLVPDIHHNLAQLRKIVERIHSGQWRGMTGSAINTVVNIGVGGSDLGPLMACNALTDQQIDKQQLEIHFVSSIDGSQLAELLNSLNPAETLFVIASKSFTTIDTMANAQTAREWLKQSSHYSEEIILSRHFIGVSANPQKATEWGIPEAHQLKFWEWTGGRYSMWSTIGLPIALKIGFEGFTEMLAGAHRMDNHFRYTPFAENLPVLLALTGIWNINFHNINAHAILPYDGRLRNLPAYLEQLEMESNGKSVSRDGNKVSYKTCPILWGEIGSNAQHAFYQLLHQGTESVMCDFIVTSRRYHNSGNSELQYQQKLNLSNCLAQSRVLALGDSVLKDSDNSPEYKRYYGNQPCTTILINELTANAFGQLIALYEHKVFVQSVIWDINPFDQWGVELGKTVANEMFEHLNPNSNKATAFDSSTNGLIAAIRELHKEDGK